MKPRFYTFWAINGPLEQARLRRQLEQFRAVGFDGVVWHPRFYPGEPPYLGDCYLAEVSDVILHAKSLGLAFWLYDEDGWPSGTVGGQLLKKYPGDAQRWADLATEKPERCLAAFERDGKKWFLAERVGASVDYFNPDLGWTWRTKGEFTFAVKLPAGTHRLRLELVPNTFNGFGPRHYYAGDGHVVSPDQIKGVRNFADAPDAPAQTHVAAWHFRRFTLPSAIVVA